MLVTSIFSFSHNVFRRPLSQARQKLGLFGKELILYQTTKFQTFPNWRQSYLDANSNLVKELDVFYEIVKKGIVGK